MLRSSAVNNIPNAVNEVQSGLNQISDQRVFYGNALNQINLIESFLSQEENGLAGADLAAVSSNFAQAQLANQATLSASARVLGIPTLLDYLK